MPSILVILSLIGNPKTEAAAPSAAGISSPLLLLLILHEYDLSPLLVADSPPPLPPVVAVVICCCCHCHLLSPIVVIIVLPYCHLTVVVRMENYDEKEAQEVEVDDGKKRKTPLRSNGKDKDDGVVKVSGEFSQEACRMALVKMIVKDELPFSFVEAEGFLEFMQNCCPRFDMSSRRTITRDILELGIERLFAITVDNASANKVAITYVKKKEKNSYGGLMVLDVPIGWNSIYLMLHKAVVFEKSFDKMKEDDGHYVNWFIDDEGEKMREGPPNDDDWANAMSSMYESRKVEELKSNIKELLMKLYNRYISGSDVRNSGGICFGDIHNGSSGGGGASSSIMSIDLFSSFKMMKQSSNDDISSKHDVEKYLTDANESTSNAHFDILTWWKLNGHRYPILSQIAKDVLAIPVSIVASKSAFTIGGRVLDPFKSSLHYKKK
ncbi:hypothetical protein WN943_023105 [Citrus x changshan-huyou]